MPPSPIVYIRQGQRVLIGPKDAWKPDDRVTIPGADRPWPHNDTVDGFDGVVMRVDQDGLAWAVPYIAEEDFKHAA